MHPIYGTSTFMKPFTLMFNGQPVHNAATWHECAAAAVAVGLATYAFKTLFVPFPGVKIASQYRS